MCGYWKLISCNREDREDQALLRLTFSKWSTTASHFSDTRNFNGLPNECSFDRKGRSIDLGARQGEEELCQVTSCSDNDVLNLDGYVLVFGREEFKQIAKCFRQVPDGRNVDSSSKALSSENGEILKRSVDVATRMVTLWTLFLTYSFV